MQKVLTLITIAAVTAVVVMAASGKSDNKNGNSTENLQPVAATQVKPVVKKKATTTSYQSPVMRDETQNTAKAKKGWSKAAKGAVIGAASGAVVGAVVNKRNRAAGAAIGGAIGAGGGYVIGRTMDKKDGRY